MITLPEIAGATTVPTAGRYNVPSGEDFAFILRPTATDDLQPKVTTGRLSDAEDGVVITPQADGSYHVRIVNVRLNLTLSVEFTAGAPSTGTATVAGGGSPQVMHHDGLLTVRTPRAEQITLYSPSGALLYQAQKAAGEATYRIDHLPKGMIIVKGSSGWAKKTVH
jgi:hypothetical protein